MIVIQRYSWLRQWNHVTVAATQTKKKKKKVTPNKSALDSRSSSGVKAKRTKGIQATPADSAGKKRVKSAKKRGGKGKAVSTGTDADPPVIERDNTALISGKHDASILFIISIFNLFGGSDTLPYETFQGFAACG